ncbi:eukaryotic translation elongation factor 1 epsilon-1 [Pteropus vampyrus]|uniref:Eukaryotic translation elongation factor 1 epsilon-1 n=1 Tax=Pteropus vampyrus TaxID=132908 RepID=A0A6P3QLT6_PTEVA|nr:eukaryotic translation elongation factor 1 epsilon-1 [Pteropus vampyrus]
MAAAATTELMLLEKSLGLSKGNKYSAQGERQIPVLQTNNGPSLTGLTTIAAHLVKQANKEYLLGSTAEEKAIVQQWLEYRVTRVDGYSNKDDIRILLKVSFRAPMEVCHSFRKTEKVEEIAEQSRTTSHKACPRGSMVPIGKVDLTVQEKEKYLNVSRWFCHIQHYPGIRQHLSSVVFIKNRLYTNSH